MLPTFHRFCFRGRSRAPRQLLVRPLGDGGIISGEHRALEFARRHRLGEHLTLQQVEAELADSEKVRLRLHASATDLAPVPRAIATISAQ